DPDRRADREERRCLDRDAFHGGERQARLQHTDEGRQEQLQPRFAGRAIQLQSINGQRVLIVSMRKGLLALLLSAPLLANAGWNHTGTVNLRMDARKAGESGLLSRVAVETSSELAERLTLQVEVEGNGETSVEGA